MQNEVEIRQHLDKEYWSDCFDEVGSSIEHGSK